MSRMRCVMPVEPGLNVRTWQKEKVMEEYLDSLIFLGMPLGDASETEAYSEPPNLPVKLESIDITVSDEAACSPAPQLPAPKRNRFLQRNEVLMTGVVVSIIALLLTIGVSL